MSPSVAPTAASTSAIPSSTTPQQQQAPSLFDPSHIPSLLPRIQTLIHLLLRAAQSPHSLNEPLTPEQRQAVQAAHEQRRRIAREAERAARDAKGPNVALGASTEGDDDDDAYAFFTGGHQQIHVGSSSKGAATAQAVDDEGTKAGLNEALLGRPTALREDIVREAQALKDAFASARRAIDALEGGDMDVHEQAALIRVLAAHAARQDQVRLALFDGSAALLHSDSGAMET
ncbi:hypothetical protein V8E36_007416 [Tilletia maclaganii]